MAIPAVSNTFIMKDPKNQMQQGPMLPGATGTQIPPEAYATVLKIIDPEGLFLNKLSRLLYNSYLVKLPENASQDPNSPIPGYRLYKIGGDANWKEENCLTNWEGYSTITNNYILLASEIVSTTQFDTKEVNLKKVCIDGIWAIIVQVVTNWEDWKFKDPAEIMPMGIAMWFNLYGLMRRSTGRNTMMEFLTGIFKYLASNKRDDEEDKGKVRFWGNPNGAN